MIVFSDTTDDLFLKDAIIRYPSALSLRRSQNIEEQEPKIVEGNSYRGHFRDTDDQHSVRMEEHVSQLSEYLEKGSISNKSNGRRSPSPENEMESNYGKCNSSHSIQTNYYHDQNCGDGFNHPGSKSKRSSKMDLPSCKFI